MSELETYDQWLDKRSKEKSLIIPFVTAIREVCEKYGYSIAHQDFHGAFIIEPFNEDNMRRLANAELELPDETP